MLRIRDALFLFFIDRAIDEVHAAIDHMTESFGKDDAAMLLEMLS